MIIAVASAKGGTGKTTLSVAMAQSHNGKTVYLDCDVEEPNGNIFLKAINTVTHDVCVKVPTIDENNCTSCGKCTEICQFNAIINLGGAAMVFPELCHSCGGCSMICPNQAISEVEQKIGWKTIGTSDKITTVEGVLSIGHAMAPPIIRSVKKHLEIDALNIIDCPPGSSCPMVTAVKGADFVILITEPTPFGLHDLKIAVKTLKELQLNFGVVINRSDSGDQKVIEYCQQNNISLLLEIADSREIAQAYSIGEITLSQTSPIKDLVKKIVQDYQANRNQTEQ